MPIRVRLDAATSRTLAKREVARPAFQRTPLRRSGVRVAREAVRPLRSLRRASRGLARKLVETARVAMVTRSRELHAFSNPNIEDVLVGEMGRGLRVVLIGLEPRAPAPVRALLRVPRGQERRPRRIRRRLVPLRNPGVRFQRVRVLPARGVSLDPGSGAPPPCPGRGLPHLGGRQPRAGAAPASARPAGPGDARRRPRRAASRRRPGGRHARRGPPGGGVLGVPGPARWPELARRAFRGGPSWRRSSGPSPVAAIKPHSDSSAESGRRAPGGRDVNVRRLLRHARLHRAFEGLVRQARHRANRGPDPSDRSVRPGTGALGESPRRHRR